MVGGIQFVNLLVCMKTWLTHVHLPCMLAGNMGSQGLAIRARQQGHALLANEGENKMFELSPLSNIKESVVNLNPSSTLMSPPCQFYNNGFITSYLKSSTKSGIP